MYTFSTKRRNFEIMKLKQVTIDGYRNIDFTTVSFDTSITALVSPNSYGKSNFFSGIGFAIDFIRSRKENKTRMMCLKRNVPLNVISPSKDFFAEFVLEDSFENKNYLICYGFSFAWINDKKKYGIKGEWLKYKENIGKQKYSSLIDRKEEAQYKPSETGRCNKKILLEKNELAVNALSEQHAVNSQLYNRFYSDINNMKAYVERHFDPSQFYGLSDMFYPSDMVPDDFEDIATLNYFNVPRATYALKAKYPEKFDLLVDAFTKLFPNIQSLSVERIDLGKSQREIMDSNQEVPLTLSHIAYSLMVKDCHLNQSIDFSYLSDGVKRVFLTLINLFITQIEGYTFIALEEPENSIYPALLNNYLHVLPQLNSTCPIIVSSHSPYLVNYLSPKSIYIGTPDINGTARFKKISDSKLRAIERDAEECNLSLGSYIFELLSGDEEDNKLLSSYLEQKEDDKED